MLKRLEPLGDISSVEYLGILLLFAPEAISQLAIDKTKPYVYIEVAHKNGREGDGTDEQLL
jgi:hypothetical protein